MRSIRLSLSQLGSEILPRFSGAEAKPDDILHTFVKDYKANALSIKEMVLIRAIEKVRAKMLRDKAPLTRADYGAGAANATAAERIKDVCKGSSKSQDACKLLYFLTRNLKPEHALELGTCLGISCAYQAAAYPTNHGGKIFTIEGSPDRARVAKANLENLSLQNKTELISGRFEDVLTSLLPELDFIDYAFIDGHHKEDAVLQYFQQLLPRFKKGGVMIFDDIFWSPGMYRAWQTIKNSGKFSAILEYKGMGFGTVNS